MDPEVRKELDTLHALVRDNHRMLRAIRRDHWFDLFGKIIIWVIVLILPLYLYQQYIKPLLAQYGISGSSASSTSSGSFGLPSSKELQDLIHSYQGQ